MEFMNFTVNETADKAKKMLEDDIVFLTSADVFYMNGEKHSYSGFGGRSFVSDGFVMVDIELFSKALNIEYSLVNETVKIGGKTYFAHNKNGKVYIYAANIAKDLGRYVYEDNRNFVLISTENRGYINSIDSYESEEPIDVLWRYLHFDRPDYNELYKALVNSDKYKKHPRLFVTEDRIPKLKEKVLSDPYMQGLLARLVKDADALIDTPPRERIMYGIRLFGSCATVKERLFKLSVAYIFTDDAKYAERAWVEIESSLNWCDLNLDQHFLDSGEYGPGIAIAYDTFYYYFTDEQKRFIRERMTELYLNFCVGVYRGENSYNGMRKKNIQCNWGAVCGTSMLLCALTFMDEEAPESEFTAKCKYIAVNAMQTLEHIATGLSPEGKWDEGMGYWEYVLEHLGWTMTSLENIFGTTFGFKDVPGMCDLPKLGMYLQTHNGVFNYASPSASKGCTGFNFVPEVFIYANMYNDIGITQFYDAFYKELNQEYGYYRYLLFAPKPDTLNNSKTKIAPDKYYKTSGMCSLRTDFNDPDGIYLGVVGGTTGEYNNSHFDKGSFIFEALGERWLIDMGRNGNDTYPYLKRTETHNAVSINPSADNKGQEMGVPVYATRFESKPEGALVVYDLSDAYGTRVKEYKRGFKLTDNRTVLEVRDEISLQEKSDIHYNLITRADVTIDKDGMGVTLRQNGKECKIAFYSNASDFKIAIGDLTPVGNFESPEQEKFAEGVRRIRLLAEAEGDVVFSARITPITYGVECKVQDDVPIKDWRI